MAQAANGLTTGLCRSVAIMMGLFVFLNPFPHTTALKEMTFYGSLAVALYLFASGKKPFSLSSPLTLPFLLLVAWSAVGIFFALDRANSLHDVLYHLLKYVTFFFLIITVYHSRHNFHVLSWIVILSTAIFVIASIVHFYVILDHSFVERLGYSVEYTGKRSFFEMSSNYMGFITVFAALLSMNQFVQEDRMARKALLALCFIATVTATLLTQTRGAVIGLILATILFGMKTRRELLLVVLLPILVASFFFAGTDSRERFSMKSLQSNERVGIGLMYWEIIKEHPLKGIGFGMEILQKKEFMAPYYERVPVAHRDPAFNMSPHNLYLDITVRLGAVGLLLYLYIFFTALRMAWRSFGHVADPTIRNSVLCLVSSFCAFLVQAFFSDASFGPQAIVFYLHLAMITILWKESCEIPAAGGRVNAIRPHE